MSLRPIARALIVPVLGLSLAPDSPPAARTVPCECPSRLKRWTLEEVERGRRDGLVTHAEADAYLCAWQRGAVRYGTYSYAHKACLGGAR